MEERTIDQDKELPITDEEGNEVVFEMPDLEEDENLATMSVEEAERYKKRKAEENEKKKEEYERLLKEANDCMAEDNFRGAARRFAACAELFEDDWRVFFGYAEAKSERFVNLKNFEEYELHLEDVSDLIDEEGRAENRAKYSEQLESRKNSLCEKLNAAEAEFLPAQEERRGVFKEIRKKARIFFYSFLGASVVALAAAIFCAVNILSVNDGSYVIATIITGVIAAGLLATTLVFARKALNADRRVKANERYSSTPEGRRCKELKARIAAVEKIIGCIM